MGANVSFKFNGSIQRIIDKATNKRETLLFAATTWHRLIDPFTPMDTGTLAHDDVQYSVESNSGVIHYTAPYAKKVYEGENTHFRKEKHPLASARWDQAAITAGKGETLINDVQKYINRKG